MCDCWKDPCKLPTAFRQGTIDIISNLINDSHVRSVKINPNIIIAKNRIITSKALGVIFFPDIHNFIY